MGKKIGIIIISTTENYNDSFLLYANQTVFFSLGADASAKRGDMAKLFDGKKNREF